jgi:hypothetical protein
MVNIKNPNKLVVGASCFAIMFILIGHIYKDKIQSVLKTELLSIDKITFDYWSVSHFLLFAFFGFVKPGYTFSFFTMGCAFEVFEDCLASDLNTQLTKCPSNNIKSVFMCNGIQDGYWYGKIDDIFSNLIGYVVGQSIRLTFFNNIIS